MHHPCGIQPEGNLLLRSGSANCRDQGLGNLSVLSDALLLDILGYLEPSVLAGLACCSKALYCFCDHEDLWKAHVLEVFEGSFVWCQTWKDSYKATLAAAQAKKTGHIASIHSSKDAPDIASTTDATKRKQKRRKKGAKEQIMPNSQCPNRAVVVSNFYSDLLYQPWHCATVELDPSWLEVDNVDRRSGLTWEQFHQQYELPNQPVVITDGAAAWPALKKWNIPYLKSAYGDRPVIAGNFQLPFSTYVSYAETTHDEMPLYLFDKHFAKAASGLAGDFSVPAVFQEDLFSVLGDNRPDYRWLIAGPARSGSSFHIDPNATSAWNAVVCGAKKWILYPPGVIPPGVHPSVDGADVATPVSLIEWFLNFYDDTREGKVKPLECICRPGEVMFVPRGWWHACLNLGTWTIAVTQNFVSRANLSAVLDFLKPGRSDLVSGCALEDRGQLHDRFLAALKEKHADLLLAVENEKAMLKKKAEEARRLTAIFKTQDMPSSTTTLTAPGASSQTTGQEAQAGSFSFGFSFGFKPTA